MFNAGLLGLYSFGVTTNLRNSGGAGCRTLLADPIIACMLFRRKKKQLKMIVLWEKKRVRTRPRDQSSESTPHGVQIRSTIDFSSWQATWRIIPTWQCSSFERLVNVAKFLCSPCNWAILTVQRDDAVFDTWIGHVGLRKPCQLNRNKRSMLLHLLFAGKNTFFQLWLPFHCFTLMQVTKQGTTKPRKRQG